MSGTQSGQAEASLLDRAGFFLLTSSVILAPIPFGSSSAATASIMALALALCLLVSAWAPMPSDRVRRLFHATTLLSAVIVLWSVAQLWVWHSGLAADPILSEAVRHIAEEPEPLLALGYQRLQAAGYVLIPLVSFMCALAYVRDDGRYLSFVHAVLGANLVVAVLCLGQYIAAPRSLLWADKRHYLDAFTGTFVNPNTAATHFGVLLILALSLTLRQLELAGLGRLMLVQRRWSPKDEQIVRMLIAYTAATFAFTVALLLTKSRAGIISTLLGVAGLVASFYYLSLRRRASLMRTLGISAFGLFAVGVVVVVFGQRLLLRLQDQGLIESGRLCTYEATWNAIREGPWWGFGLGTFQDVFPAYRNPACGLYGYWEMAHSVFLEGWLALGVAFLACVVVVYYQLIKTYGRGMLVRRRFRFVPLGCLCLLLVLTLHSLVDFSLQVLGFSVAASAMMGAGAAVSLAREPGGRRTARSGLTHRSATDTGAM
jgi:O-antigen ligase